MLNIGQFFFALCIYQVSYKNGGYTTRIKIFKKLENAIKELIRFHDECCDSFTYLSYCDKCTGYCKEVGENTCDFCNELENEKINKGMCWYRVLCNDCKDRLDITCELNDIEIKPLSDPFWDNCNYKYLLLKDDVYAQIKKIKLNDSEMVLEIDDLHT